jgi:uncharacterized membrane protein YccC
VGRKSCRKFGSLVRHRLVSDTRGTKMGFKWDKPDWKNAALTAVGACLCYWITEAVGLRAGYWAVISCVAVSQSEVGATLAASKDRFIGTAIGAAMGWGAVLLWHEHILIFGAAVLVTLAICNALGLKVAGHLAGVTVAIVVLTHGDGPAWQTAMSRFVEVALGVAIALVLSAIFNPRILLNVKR